MFHYYFQVLGPVKNGTTENVIAFLRERGILKFYECCPSCSNQIKIVLYTRNKDGQAFRCYNTHCSGYKKYHSIRKTPFVKIL